VRDVFRQAETLMSQSSCERDAGRDVDAEGHAWQAVDILERHRHPAAPDFRATALTGAVAR
jgi:hypothetical protein